MNSVIVAALLCAHCVHVFAFEDGDVRLAGGAQQNEGRVEVYYRGEWGTVCDDNWSMAGGSVVCRKLGYDGASKISYNAAYGPGTGRIWLDELNCLGTEPSLLSPTCQHNPWGVHDCSHAEDASVVCVRKQVTRLDSLPVRLSCPQYNAGGSCFTCPSKRFTRPGDCSLETAVQGIVEVYNNGQWLPLSGKDWNTRVSKVVCGELGYPIALKTPTMSQLWPNYDGSLSSTCSSGSCDPRAAAENNAFRNGLRRTFLSGLDCTGNEAQLRDCYYAGVGPYDNADGDVAIARCGFIPHPTCLRESSEIYRLRGSAVPWAGRVEARIGGVWGTICDRLWDSLDANIVCRALGYGSAKAPTFRAQYGRGAGKIHFTELKCTGKETLVSSCPNKAGVTAEQCGHVGDAGVVCNVPSSQCWTPSSKLYQEMDLQNPAYINNFVEVDGPSGRGILCFNTTFDFDAGNTICRESNDMFMYRARQGVASGYTGAFYRGEVACDRNAMRASECNLRLTTVDSCPEGHLVVDCTAGLPDLVPDISAFQRSLQNYPYVDRQPMYYLTCALQEGCLADSAKGQPPDHYRSLLRFDSQTMNWGTADFLSNLQPNQWIWHSCHNHYHSFKGFNQYEFLNYSTGLSVADGRKVSFCLEDSACPDGSPQYQCGNGVQGISANCGDVYGGYLDCQWVDVTDVPFGRYVLRQHVNPNRFVPESDDLNNVATCTIDYFPGYYVKVISCALSDH